MKSPTAQDRVDDAVLSSYQGQFTYRATGSSETDTAEPFQVSTERVFWTTLQRVTAGVIQWGQDDLYQLRTWLIMFIIFESI